jgi:hypothetical protein
MEKLKHTTICILFLLLIFGGISIVNAQDKELKGKVVSASNTQPLPYVNITIPKKGVSTVSNEDGVFIFKFPGDHSPQDSIIFSSVGYKQQAISINDALKQKDIVVTLTESVQELKEVVIKPLTIKELLDSIGHHNYMAFNSPMKLNGYYREFVFTNAKCTEYSDALFEYYYDHGLKNDGQLKIAASRCEKAVQKKEENHSFTALAESRIEPDKILGYSMLLDMIKGHFADKLLDDYTYNIEEDNNKDLLITILPKTKSDKYYKLQFTLTPDYTIKSYKLEIPANLLANVKERSMMGIHAKITAFEVECRYQNSDNYLYPDYFKATKTVKIFGKFMGVVLDQVTAQKSEFVVTQFAAKNINPFAKSETYKKGNMCDNGVAMNADMLKNYNFILPTKKDSLVISSIAKDIAADK